MIRDDDTGWDDDGWDAGRRDDAIRTELLQESNHSTNSIQEVKR